MSHVSFTYPVDADSLYRFIVDPEEIKKRCADSGDQNIRVEVKENGATKTITCTREVEQDLPAFAKKLFKPRNTVVERKEWRDEGTKKVCSMHVDVLGTPTQIDGTITISPSGTSSTYDIQFEVSAKVPLIRKKLEEYIAGITADGMRNEFEYNRRALENR
ncbi:MAG: DUF2505 domain-containing protein [Polyangiales bacterium]